MRSSSPRTATIRAVRGYCRVSSDRQVKGTSLEAQERSHRAYCAARSLPAPVIYVEVESGSEGKIEAREEQLRLQREAEPGDLVIVTALDRWSRDIIHTLETIRALLARGINFIATNQSIDASTPEGMLMIKFQAIGAENELDNIKERMVGGRRRIAAAGGYAFGEVPIGYRRTSDRRIESHPDEAALIREVFRRCIAGESTTQIARATRHPRGHKWNGTTVKQLLHSRWILGEARISKNDAWRPGAHEAIVNLETWEAAHACMTVRRIGGRQLGEESLSARALLRGLTSCVRCGKRVSVHAGGRRRGMAGLWYACRSSMHGGVACGEKWSAVEQIDELAAGLTLARLEELREHLAAPPVARAVDVGHGARLSRDLAQLEARKRRAVALALDADDTTTAALREALASIENEARDIRAQLARDDAERARHEAAADPARRAAVLRSVDVLRAAWDAAPVAERREWIRLLAHRVDVGRSIVRPVWRTVEEMMVDESTVGSSDSRKSKGGQK